MKRIIAIVMVLVALATTTNAQIFRYGIKGGVNSSKISVDKTLLKNISTKEDAKDFWVQQGESKLGFHAGIFGRIQIFGVFMQPELLMTQTQGVLKVTEDNTTIEQFVNLKVNRFDVPVMLGKKFGPAKVFLGPVASFVISEKSNFKEALNVESAENELKKAVFGYQAGVGIDILKLATLDIKYEGNLSKLGNSLSIGGNDFNLDQRNPQIIFSLGIFL